MQIIPILSDEQDQLPAFVMVCKLLSGTPSVVCRKAQAARLQPELPTLCRSLSPSYQNTAVLQDKGAFHEMVMLEHENNLNTASLWNTPHALLLILMLLRSMKLMMLRNISPHCTVPPPLKRGISTGTLQPASKDLPDGVAAKSLLLFRGVHNFTKPDQVKPAP